MPKEEEKREGSFSDSLDILKPHYVLNRPIERLMVASQIQEFFASIDRLGGIETLVDRFRTATQPTNLGSIADVIQYSMPGLDDLRSMMRFDNTILRSIDAWTQAFSKVELLSVPSLDLQLLDGSGFRKVLEQQLILREQIESISRAYTSSVGHLALQAVDRISHSLAGIRAFAEQLRFPNVAVVPALKVSQAYADFCNRQFTYAARDTDMVRKRRMEITDLAGAILDYSQASWERLAPVAEDEASPNATALAAPPNVFSEINRQLSYAYRRDASIEPGEAFESCDAVATSTLGSTIVSLVYEINESVVYSGGDNVFKPSNKNLRACAVLSATIATNESTFAQTVDALYFLVYEGSGSAKRLTDRFERDELEPLWLIKRLRTGFRHDLEHGDQRDIKKKMEELGSDFVDLCGEARPVKASSWRKAQSQLFHQVSDFLRWILDSTGQGLP